MTRHLSTITVPALVGLGLLAGLLREVTLAYFFGTSRAIEIFRVAFGLPTVLSDALAVSFVSVLIPILLEYRRTRQVQSLNRVLSGSALMAGGVFLIGILTMPLQARLLAPGITGAHRELLISAGWLCWGMFLLVILSLPLRAAMSIQGRIWPGAAAQLTRSGSFVITVAASTLILAKPTVLQAATAALLAGGSVLALHVLAIGRRGRWTVMAAIGQGLPPLSTLAPLISALSLVFLTQLLLSGGRIIDRAVASEMPAGTLAAIEYSYALLMASAAVIATSSNIVLAPRIGRSIRESGVVAYRFWLIIGGIAAIAVALGTVVASHAPWLVATVYQYGAFSDTDTALTAHILYIHAFALGPLVLALVLTQVLILSGRQRWLIPIAASKLAAKATTLWLMLRAGFGLDSLPLSLGVAEAATVLMLGGTLLATNAPRTQRYN